MELSTIAPSIVLYMNMLPEQDQILAFELVKRMVLAWDSDFTKLTKSERESIEKANKEYISNEIVNHSDVWN